MFPEKQDAEKANFARDLVEYCITDGQKIADKMGYIPLPEPVVDTVRSVSQNIQ
jgi:phosphate transport system substrate-binding protein